MVFTTGTVTMGRAIAQPDPNNPPKAVNPRGKTDAERAAELEARRKEKLAQREAKLRVAQGQYIANLMKNADLTDKGTQDAVADYWHEVSKVRPILLRATARIRTAMKNQATKDTEIATLVTDYRGALADYQERLKQAEVALEKKTEFSKKPRLEAIVIMLRSTPTVEVPKK